MAAYAALASLSKVIDLTMPQERKYIHICSKEQMMSLQEEIGRLQDLLEHISGRSDSSANGLESRIRDVAYQLEDIIEFAVLSSQCENSTSSFPVEITPSEFGSCATEIGILLEQGRLAVLEMKETNLQAKYTPGESHPSTMPSSSSEAPSAKMDLNEVPVKIMDWIFRSESKLQVVPVTGMGGIGKTTLARAVYEHPKTMRHFDVCSWVTVSQEYNVNEILRGLLPSEQQSEPDERLIEFVHKRLIGRRYLIVLDDMWDEKAWDRVSIAFPDDKKGSRVILTTRLVGVAKYIVGYSGHVHQMKLLNEDQSWDLLREKVDGNEQWPKKLEDLGRTISRNCRGLPLAVVAMAGLLKINKTEEYWERVARDTKSEAATNYDDHLFGVLALSYNNLPPYLKPCFLYFGLFKEDEEIPTRELVRLWTAEGFLKPRGDTKMEEVAEEYLEELVARSLVLVKKKRRNGRIKTCSIHDVLRELSQRKAHQEKFSHRITGASSWMDVDSKDLRRVSLESLHSEELVHHTHVRSLRHRDSIKHSLLSVIQHPRLIRVLSKVVFVRSCHLSMIYEFTSLRYLHIYLSSVGGYLPPVKLGESISELQNLETLVISGVWLTTQGHYNLILPSGIWKIQRLQHLIIVGKEAMLPCPELSEISCNGLQTLTWVRNLDLSRSMTAKLSNLKKLKLYYYYSNYDYDGGDSSDVSSDTVDEITLEFRLNSLVHLHQLEVLYINSCGATEVTDLSFPDKLKKLSLSGTYMDVENMSLIGSLPNLEVLKLKDYAVTGKVWEPVEGEFLQLKYLEMYRLRLEEWKAESEHFPQLETLIIKSCEYLKEVPAGIGEINTLQKLFLKDCTVAEESVEEIKAEQESLCNDSLQVIISRRMHGKLKRKCSL